MPRSSSKQGPTRKPKADIFTVLLILALVALIAACAFVYIDISRYEAGLSSPVPTPFGAATVVATATTIHPSETGIQPLSPRLV